MSRRILLEPDVILLGCQLNPTCLSFAGGEGHMSVGRVRSVHVATCVVAASCGQLSTVYQRRRQSRRHGNYSLRTLCLSRPVVLAAESSLGSTLCISCSIVYHILYIILHILFVYHFCSCDASWRGY